MSVKLRRIISHSYLFIFGFTIAATLFLDPFFLLLFLTEIAFFLASIAIFSLSIDDNA